MSESSIELPELTVRNLEAIAKTVGHLAGNVESMNVTLEKYVVHLTFNPDLIRFLEKKPALEHLLASLVRL